MGKNYFLTLLRQLSKYRSTYTINILGLAFGLACCLVCFVHIRYEYSFDQFHSEGKQLYRMVNGDPATVDHWVKTAAPIPPKLKAEVPEVESFTRLHSVTHDEKVLVEYDGELLLEPNFLMADPNFFDVFNFPLITGSASSLAEQNSVFLSETAAARILGDNPIGKVIRLKDLQLEFLVKGIFKDLPSNTHLRCDFLISFENLDRVFGKGSSESWNQYNYFAYIKLQQGADVVTVNNKIQALTQELPGTSQVSFKKFQLQPVTDIHFQHNRGNMLPAYDIRYLYIFGTMALSVLVICLMNYFNISAMLSIKRMKEVGIRKSIGATTAQLNRQFLLESLGLSTISLLLCVLLVELLKPLLSSLLASPVRIPYTDPYFVLFTVVLFGLLVVVCCAYLVFHVNRIQSVSMVKAATGKTAQSGLVQHTLIFFQFGISTMLLISSYVIVTQMRFLQSKNLGFDKEQVIRVNVPKGIDAATRSSLKNEVAKSGNVEQAAFSDFVPGKSNWNNSTWWEGQTEPESMSIITAGMDFIPTMKIDLVEGNLEELRSSTEIQYLVNEAALEQIGWATGKGRFISPFGEQRKKAILGVVKDFNFRSLHNKIAPLVLVVYPDRTFSQLYVRLTPGGVKKGIEETETAFKSLIPGLPFEFSFLDESIDKLYEAETRMEDIVVVLTMVSVIFALLGIYTLISFAIENRMKEVAIRKVLGISANQLIGLFTTSYFKLAVMSGLLVIPVCWKLAAEWLTHFDYRIEPSISGFFGILLIMVVLVAGIGLVKYLSIDRINPAATLRSE